MIINRIYETQNFLVAVACFLPGRANDLSAPLYIDRQENFQPPSVRLYSLSASINSLSFAQSYAWRKVTSA